MVLLISLKLMKKYRILDKMPIFPYFDDLSVLNNSIKM